jgi:hypothetical protein
MIRFLPSLLFVCMLFPLAAMAQGQTQPPAQQEQPVDKFDDPVNQFVPKDSVFFTMDDGIMTPEEMQQEAMYVHGLCDSNPMQRQYYDCECFAGAFLVQREKLGPTVMQEQIIMDMTATGKSTCADTAAVAGKYYQNCLDIQTTYYELSTPEENEAICSCAARVGANDYGKQPFLDATFIAGTLNNAITYCTDPANRDRQPAEPAAAPAATVPPKAAN